MNDTLANTTEAMQRRLRKLLPLCVLCLLAACESKTSSTGGDGKPQVLTTFYPTTYFAQRLVGDYATVRCPVPEGEDPIFWMPDAAAIAEYQSADLIVVNGAAFEKWVAKVNLPESRVVDTASGFADRFIEYQGTVTHSHGPKGEHAHEGLDGHTWLAPELAVLQVQALQGACARVFPDHKADINTRARALIADLEALSAEFAKVTLPPILASHPAYNYIARQYGWQVHNLDLDPDAIPDSAQVAEVQGLLAQGSYKHLLWEGEPRAETQQLFAKLGLQSLVFSPCEMLESGSDTDYLKVMRANLTALQSIQGQ